MTSKEVCVRIFTEKYQERKNAMVEQILKLQSSWEFFKSTDLPIVLYGTGNGADKVIDEFEKLEIKIAGIIASDGFVRKRTFRGFEVKSIADAEKELGDFALALCFGSQLEDVIENIINISKKHKLLVPSVPVYEKDIFNREFFEKNRLDIEKVYDILYDDKSKEVFLDFLKFELTGELEYLFKSETDKDEAFYNILKLGSGETYLDLGAYRGDTVEEFLKYSDGRYEQIIALEPDRKSFKKLIDFLNDKENTLAVNKGIWDSNGTVCFKNGGGRNNSVNSDGFETEVTTVDSIAKSFNITYLKADTEGCEYKLLCGAENTLKAAKPKLNIAAYHKSRDIIDLVFKINEINPEYKIHLRHHRYIPCWDLNLYCI